MKRVWTALMLVATLAAGASAQDAAGAVTVVLPFDGPAGDSRVHWMREGVAVLLDEILESRGVVVVGRDERNIAFERLQLPTTTALSRASAIKVGQLVGAGAIVVGTVEPDATGLILTARTILLDTARLSAPVTVKGEAARLFELVEDLGTQLAGGAAAEYAWTPPPSLLAFEWLTRGLIAESPIGARVALEQALKAAPGYDLVRLALWRHHTDQGEHQQALGHVEPIADHSPVADEARYLAALSLIRLKRDGDAFSVLSNLLKQAPEAAVANALGVVQLRRGGTPQTGSATYYFNLATEMAPADADPFFNLGYAYWLERDANGAVYWLREAVRRNPADGDAHYVLAAALQQMGARAEAERERELARRLSERYAPPEGRPAAAPAPVPRGLERLQSSLRADTTDVDMRLTASGQREQAKLAAFHLDAGRRAFERGSDRDAMRELQRSIYLSPYLAEAHLLVGRIHMRAGRIDDAVQALKIAVWSEESAATLVALASALIEAPDLPAARAAADRATVLAPRDPAVLALKARLGATR